MFTKNIWKLLNKKLFMNKNFFLSASFNVLKFFPYKGKSNVQLMLDLNFALKLKTFFSLKGDFNV